jgi:hypothetical protein
LCCKQHRSQSPSFAALIACFFCFHPCSARSGSPLKLGMFRLQPVSLIAAFTSF